MATGASCYFKGILYVAHVDFISGRNASVVDVQRRRHLRKPCSARKCVDDVSAGAEKFFFHMVKRHQLSLKPLVRVFHIIVRVYASLTMSKSFHDWESLR